MINTCKICGCTDLDCRQCIQKTGEPCYWADNKNTLCSACIPIWTVSLMVDNFELFHEDSGLCNLPNNLFREKIITMNEAFIMEYWIKNNIPFAKYSREDYFHYPIIFSWKFGDKDARWYWLQSKLKEIKNG